MFKIKQSRCLMGGQTALEMGRGRGAKQGWGGDIIAEEEERDRSPLSPSYIINCLTNLHLF